MRSVLWAASAAASRTARAPSTCGPGSRKVQFWLQGLLSLLAVSAQASG